MLKTKNMKIIVIASVSVAILALGLGLGFGLSDSSSTSPAAEQGTMPGGGQGETKTLPSGETYTINSETNKLIVKGHEYDYLKENGEEYVIVPAHEATFSEPLVTIPTIPNVLGNWYEYDDNHELKIGKGKDYFYQVYFFALNAIKITNDGKIWAGFDPEYLDNDISKEITGFKLKQADAQEFPNDISDKLPFQVGSFDDEGHGGLNLLLIERYEALIDDSDQTVPEDITENTQITWSLFEDTNDENRVKLATKNLMGSPREHPSANIAIDPDYDSGVVPQMSTVDPDTQPKPPFNPDNVQTYNFKVQWYKNQDGSDHTFTWSDNEETNKTFNWRLKDMYIPINVYETGTYTHDILGTLDVTRSGKVVFPDVIMSNDGTPLSVQIPDKTAAAPLPELKVKLT